MKRWRKHAVDKVRKRRRRKKDADTVGSYSQEEIVNILHSLRGMLREIEIEMNRKMDVWGEEEVRSKKTEIDENDREETEISR